MYSNNNEVKSLATMEKQSLSTINFFSSEEAAICEKAVMSKGQEKEEQIEDAD